MKFCTICKVEKELAEFHKDKSAKGGHRSACKDCKNKRHREYRENNPDVIREKWRQASKKYHTTDGRRNKTLRKYGLTEETYNDLFDKQDGKCIICGSDRTLCVDHCHDSGRVRGLLCNKCNLGLGHFEDDIDRMKKAIEYLKEY